jgi:chaperonin cofactor prefoldin
MANTQNIDKEFKKLDHTFDAQTADGSELKTQTAETEIEKVEPECSDSSPNDVPLEKNVADVVKATIKEELKNAERLWGEVVFERFSEKAVPFFEQRVRALERTTYGLNKTIESLAGLSRKTICMGVLSSILIGVLTYLITYWIYPPHQLSKKEQYYLLYGKVLSENFNALSPLDQKLLEDSVARMEQNKK